MQLLVIIPRTFQTINDVVVLPNTPASVVEMQHTIMLASMYTGPIVGMFIMGTFPVVLIVMCWKPIPLTPDR